VIPNQIPLDTLNSVATLKLPSAWQTAVSKYFPKGPGQQADIADPNLLDHAIWYATTHYSKPFPGDKRILYPREIRPAEPAEDRDPD
jgi:hypothetical protein